MGYFIALRMFRCSYKLALGFIEIDEGLVLEEIDLLKGIWWNAKCNYCQRSALYSKYKACTGCMKVVYCSRMCQKLDWNTEHRSECDRSWNSVYSALKTALLGRLY